MPFGLLDWLLRNLAPLSSWPYYQLSSTTNLTPLSSRPYYQHGPTIIPALLPTWPHYHLGPTTNMAPLSSRPYYQLGPTIISALLPTWPHYHPGPTTNLAPLSSRPYYELGISYIVIVPIILILDVGRWFPPGTPVSSTIKLISSSFHRLDMTLAVAEALNPNKKNPYNFD